VLVLVSSLLQLTDVNTQRVGQTYHDRLD